MNLNLSIMAVQQQDRFLDARTAHSIRHAAPDVTGGRRTHGGRRSARRLLHTQLGRRA